MRCSQAEKPRKAQGFNAAVLRLERTAKHLGAHIDAKRRLQRWPGIANGCFGRGPLQGRRQVALGCAFGGLLPDGIDMIIGVGLQRLCVLLHHLLPQRRDLLFVALKQRLVPQHANGQQFGHSAIALALQFSLPQQIAGILGPAPQRHQPRVKGAAGRLGGQAQRFSRPANGAPGRPAAGRHKGAKA